MDESVIDAESTRWILTNRSWQLRTRLMRNEFRLRLAVEPVQKRRMRDERSFSKEANCVRNWSEESFTVSVHWEIVTAAQRCSNITKRKEKKENVKTSKQQQQKRKDFWERWKAWSDAFWSIYTIIWSFRGGERKGENENWRRGKVFKISSSFSCSWPSRNDLNVFIVIVIMFLKREEEKKANFE